MTGFLPDIPAWRAEAACAGHDRALWFPVGRGMHPYAAARAICEGCVVREQCLAEALALPAGYDADGMFGGLTPEERAKMRDRRLRLAEIPHGTAAGYKAEIRRGVAHCQACRDAHRRYQAGYEAHKAVSTGL